MISVVTSCDANHFLEVWGALHYPTTSWYGFKNMFDHSPQTS